MLPETSQDISDEDDEGSDNTPTVDLSRVCHHDRSHLRIQKVLSEGFQLLQIFF